MLHKRLLIIGAVAAANVAVAAYAQSNTPELPPTPSTYAELVGARPPVTDQDITDRPYRILGEVR